MHRKSHIYRHSAVAFTEASQKAPGFQAGDEWLYLTGRDGRQPIMPLDNACDYA